MDYNRAIIVGRVTADPQLRTTPTGQSVAALGVATNRQWSDKNGQKHEDVQFHSVVIWGRLAEIAAQFLVKGSHCLIEGRLETRDWTDKQGAKRRTTEIICERLVLGTRPQGQSVSANAGSPESTPAQTVTDFGAEEEIKPEDIPF